MEEKQDFISTVPKDQTVAVIIPLFGYWRDIEEPELNLEVLIPVLSRIKSFNNKIYFLFPCEVQRLDPMIKNHLMGRQLGGNSTGVEVEPQSSYSDYVNEGIGFALEETDARFVIVINPWVAIRMGSIDKMINTLNRPDVAACSGFDMRKASLLDTDVDTHQFNPPADFFGLDINYFGVTRQIAESVKLDDSYKTLSFLSQDYYEELNRRQLPCLLTQQIPFYSFPVNWKVIEDPNDFEDDHQRFVQKWGFDVEIKENER